MWTTLLHFFSSTICEAQNVALGEFGVFDINITHQCSLKTLVEPVNDKMAILVCFLILLALGLAYNLVKWLLVKRRYKSKIEKLFQSFKRQFGCVEVCTASRLFCHFPALGKISMPFKK